MKAQYLWPDDDASGETTMAQTISSVNAMHTHNAETLTAERKRPLMYVTT
jgi:hypothetical protein